MKKTASKKLPHEGINAADARKAFVDQQNAISASAPPEDLGVFDRKPKIPTLAQIEALVRRTIKGMEPEPLPALDTVAGPKDRDDFAVLVDKGISRGLSLATTSKELSDMTKAATWWWKVRYAVKDEEPYGGALGGGKDE